MFIDTLLGKRTVEKPAPTNEAPLDSMRRLSVTPRSKPRNTGARVNKYGNFDTVNRSSDNMDTQLLTSDPQLLDRTFSQAYPPMYAGYAPPGIPEDIQSTFYSKAAAQPSLVGSYSGSFEGDHSHPMTNGSAFLSSCGGSGAQPANTGMVSGGYPLSYAPPTAAVTPSWKATQLGFVPQSPPQDSFVNQPVRPRSFRGNPQPCSQTNENMSMLLPPVVDEFGEKRRRVSHASRRRPSNSDDVRLWNNQPMTPQTPNNRRRGSNRTIPMISPPSIDQRTAVVPPNSYGGAVAPAVPVMASVTAGGSVPGPQPPIALGAIPAAPSAAIAELSKPMVVPSLTAPSHRIWRPREVQLTRIVDGGLAPDSSIECDDKSGHYIVKPGERFAWRYVIVKLLGQGTFGKVVQVWDEQLQQHCAIKIIRAIPKYRDASKIELRVLSMLANYDPQGVHRCVRMRECFDYRNHVCIVTDLYDVSVYDFLHDNKFAPFPGMHIARFAKQILLSISHIHSLGLVHTDLKPENVLLTTSASTPAVYPLPRRDSSTPSSYTSPPLSGSASSPASSTSPASFISQSSASSVTTKLARSRVKSRSPSRDVGTRKELQCTDVTLIDFGSSVFDDEYHPSVVSTRHYRAPEIIFGTGWSYPCDLWSVGCLLVELCTGRVLFETRDDLEHLHMMERTLQTKFDANQLLAAANTNQGSTLVSTWPATLRSLKEQCKIDSTRNMRTVTDLVASYAPWDENPEFWMGFTDLVGRLMTLDPAKRITAADALQHPWIMTA